MIGLSRASPVASDGVAVSFSALRASAGTSPVSLDLPLELAGAELPDGEEFEHAVLHVLQAVVVLVEDARRRA